MILTFFTSRIGLLVGAALAVFVFYEGIPVGPIAKIPFVGPVVEEATAGRVTRVRLAAVKGYVLAAERDALQAKIEETDRQKRVAEAELVSLREELSRQQESEMAADARREQEIADYEKKLADSGRVCRLDDDDLEWLRHN